VETLLDGLSIEITADEDVEGRWRVQPGNIAVLDVKQVSARHNACVYSGQVAHTLVRLRMVRCCTSTEWSSHDYRLVDCVVGIYWLYRYTWYNNTLLVDTMLMQISNRTRPCRFVLQDRPPSPLICLLPAQRAASFQYSRQRVHWVYCSKARRQSMRPPRPWKRLDLLLEVP
jgi:hypothetical protein